MYVCMMYVCIYIYIYIHVYIYIWAMQEGSRESAQWLLKEYQYQSNQLATPEQTRKARQHGICIFMYIYTHVCMYIYVHIWRDNPRANGLNCLAPLSQKGCMVATRESQRSYTHTLPSQVTLITHTHTHKQHTQCHTQRHHTRVRARTHTHPICPDRPKQVFQTT